MKIKTTYSNITYTRVGTGNFTVLFLHGTPGDSAQFSSYLSEIISSFNCGVISVDRGGYGATSKNGFQKNAYQIEELLRHEKIDSVIIYAVEAGACVATYLAALFPDRVKAMLLESPISVAYDKNTSFSRKLIPYKASVNIFWSAVVKFISKYMLKTAFSFFRESSFEKPQEKMFYDLAIEKKEYKEKFREILTTTTSPSKHKVGFQNDLEQIQNVLSLPVDKVKCPVTILYGTRNLFVKRSNIDFLEKALANVIVKRYEQSGYFLPISPRALEYEQDKIEFFNKVSGRTGKGIDKRLRSKKIPEFCTPYPSKVFTHTIGKNDFYLITEDGKEYKGFDSHFITFANKYGEVYQGFFQRDSVDLFSVASETGGYISCIMLPALKKGCEGKVIFDIDSEITEVLLLPSNTEKRCVFGGYFPHTENNNGAKTFTFGHRERLNIVSPVSDIEARSVGIYFHDYIKITMVGELDSVDYGSYAVITYLLFEKRLYD